LQDLNLYSNQLSELPESFGQLAGLQILYLYGNQLSELPESFGQLASLQTLYLSDNQLSELPASFGQLAGLQELYLYGNQLSELPEVITQLAGLQELNLGRNQLSELPEEVCELNDWVIRKYSLSSIPVSGNPLTHLPDCFLDKFTQRELLDWASECLLVGSYPWADPFADSPDEGINQEPLYHVAYETVDNLMRRFPETSEEEKAKLMARLDQLAAEGVTHEDLPKIRALLEGE
jgi:hypothetical protein